MRLTGWMLTWTTWLGKKKMRDIGPDTTEDWVLSEVAAGKPMTWMRLNSETKYRRCPADQL